MTGRADVVDLLPSPNCRPLFGEDFNCDGSSGHPTKSFVSRTPPGRSRRIFIGGKDPPSTLLSGTVATLAPPDRWSYSDQPRRSPTLTPVPDHPRPTFHRSSNSDRFSTATVSDAVVPEGRPRSSNFLSPSDRLLLQLDVGQSSRSGDRGSKVRRSKSDLCGAGRLVNCDSIGVFNHVGTGPTTSSSSVNCIDSLKLPQHRERSRKTSRNNNSPSVLVDLDGGSNRDGVSRSTPRVSNVYVDCPLPLSVAVTVDRPPTSSVLLNPYRLDSLPVRSSSPSARLPRHHADKSSPSRTAAAASTCSSGVVCRQCGLCRCDECTSTADRQLPSCWCGRRCGHCDCRRLVDCLSCVCCVQATLYHCADSDNDVTTKPPPPPSADVEVPDDGDNPCGCSDDRSSCRRRWCCLAVLSAVGCLPCLLMYWPLRAVAAGLTAAYNACGRHRGCRCPSPAPSWVAQEPRSSSCMHPETESSSA